MHLVYLCWLLLVQMMPVAGPALRADSEGDGAPLAVSPPERTYVGAASTRAPSEAIKRPLELSAAVQARASSSPPSATGPRSPIGAAATPAPHRSLTVNVPRSRLTDRVVLQPATTGEFDYFPTAPPHRA
jgi:hypothetical protein